MTTPTLNSDLGPKRFSAQQSVRNQGLKMPASRVGEIFL
jgi:hypothetical protein